MVNTEEKRPKAVMYMQNFIGGRFVDAENHLESFNPSTGEVWAYVPDSNERCVNDAVQAATAAFPAWSKLSAVSRAGYLRKIADVLERNLERLAVAESTDQGKPLNLALTVDIPRAVYNFRFFAESALQETSACSQQAQFGVMNYTQHCAVGVAGLISPWNLPLYLLTFKIAPALAFGNTVVAKPSEMTSTTAYMMCQLICDEVDLPAGVLNIVFGYGHTVGAAIASHPRIPLVSFTGSTATAVKISVAAAPHHKKLSLELGGKNPAVVFADVDLAKSLPTIIRSCFANQGEICLSSSRIFVQDEIFAKFLEKFANAARELNVGDPMAKDTNLGALISKEHLEKVKGFVDVARKEGASVACGEGVDPALELPEPHTNGYFMRPTVIYGIHDESKCMQEEIFGPVVCVVPFHEEDEVIVRANAVKYGLSASVWTNDLGRAHRVAQQLQAGTVWTNCWMVRDLRMPFGGCKHSGTGRESAADSRDFFTEAKTICVKFAET